MKFTSTIGLCLLFLAAACSGCTETSPSESVSPAAFDIDPLTIAIDFSPHHMSGYHVSINSAGNVEVTTDLHSASPTKETAIVDDAALHELRMALRRERFYALPSTLGAQLWMTPLSHLPLCWGAMHTPSSHTGGIPQTTKRNTDSGECTIAP